MNTKVIAPANIELPAGAVRIKNSGEADFGKFFVRHETGRMVGRWGYETRAKPWLISVRTSKTGCGFSDFGTFKTAESAIKAAAKRNA